MAFTVDTSQLTALTASLVKAEAKTKTMAGMAVAKTALDCEAAAKRHAPVDTGALRNSIGTSIAADRMSAEIGPTVVYGAYQEFGTSRMSAQPYMGPALDDVTPGFEQAIAQIGDHLL